MLEAGESLQLGRYRIKAQLTQGGMSMVYLASDRNLSERAVAIKENIDSSASAQHQFQHEAALLARLTHPNLPRVTDYFIEPSGRQYLVMDYIAGDDLRQMIRKLRQPLAEADALAWIGQVMDALVYMHDWLNPETGEATPIIHRDIKPGNIKRTPNGRVVLVDFGLAKYQASHEETNIGARAVTPGYSPPEQYVGGTDVRSDIYALGATLYMLLTGEKPPDAPMIANGTPLPTPRQLNAQISRNTERVILRAMQIKPDDRFQSVRAMQRAMLGYETAERTRSIKATLPGQKEPRFRPGLWLAVAAGLLALIVVLVAVRTWSSTQPDPPLLATAEPAATATIASTSSASPTISAPTPVTVGITATESIRSTLPQTLTINPRDGAVYALVAAGEFNMGSVDGADNEQPVHVVQLAAFWIMQTEVTNAQYGQCVSAGICTPPNDSHWQEPANATYPVTKVDWEQAQTYAQWVGGRLPTEAEWEKAARGADGRTYPWGNELPSEQLLNFNHSAGGATPVAQYPAGVSPYGLFDMAGNVEEWVADWYASDYYAQSPSQEPPGPPSGKLRVVRGGSFNNNRDGVRSAARGRAFPTSKEPSIGFRVLWIR